MSIPTSLKVVKIYEELNRVLSGRVDFNTFINKVSESFRKKLLDDIYALWSGATPKMSLAARPTSPLLARMMRTS